MLAAEQLRPLTTYLCEREQAVAMDHFYDLRPLRMAS